MKTRDQQLKEFGVGNIYISKINLSPLSVIESMDNYYNIPSEGYILAKDMSYGYLYSYNGEVITYWNTDVGDQEVCISTDEAITFKIIGENEYVKVERKY